MCRRATRPPRPPRGSILAPRGSGARPGLITTPPHRPPPFRAPACAMAANALVDPARGDLGPASSEDHEGAAFGAVVVLEELLDLVEESGRQVTQGSRPRMDLFRLGRADQAVVPDRLALLGLLGL